LLRTYRYRLYPTKAQAETLEGQLAVCRELYNAALQERREAWRMSRVSVGFANQSAQLTQVRADRPDVAAVNRHVAGAALRRLDKAFQAFFRRCKSGEKPGFPRFRSAASFNSLTFRRQGGFRLHERLRVSKVGDVKIKLHRPFVGIPKTATLKREGRKWHVYISAEIETAALPPSAEAIGIDVGLTHFATLSDGTAIANPRHARHAQAELRRRQRRLARRKRGSKRRLKAAVLLASCHRRVFNRRADFHHKLSRQIVNRYGLIAVEDLNVKGLAGSRLAKSVNDAAWASFIDKLAYKAESAGRELVKVDPRGTSQTCTCGASVRKRLSDREHACMACGLVADRDHVSAQVILQRSARTGPLGVNVGIVSRA
jgi:putative transposase